MVSHESHAQSGIESLRELSPAFFAGLSEVVIRNSRAEPRPEIEPSAAEGGSGRDEVILDSTTCVQSEDF